MAQPLKQSTAATVKVGPFLDTAGAVVTGLTIAQADIRLSKNGGDIAQSNNAAGATHDELGVYDVPFNTTDTDTLGRLDLYISETGALIVHHEYVVLPPNVFDSGVGAADVLQVHVVEMSADVITAAVIADGAIDAGALAADAITAAKIAAGALTAAKFAAGAFDAVWSVAARVLTAATNIIAGGGTTVAQSGDSYARLGAPAGASHAADVAAVKVDTAAILVDTGTTLDARLPAALVSGRMASDAVAISGSTAAADKLEAHAASVLQAVLAAGSTTTAIVLDAATGIDGGAPSASNDVYNGRVIVFTSGAAAGQATDITDYVGATRTLTVTALTTAPAAADTAVIV